MQKRMLFAGRGKRLELSNSSVIMSTEMHEIAIVHHFLDFTANYSIGLAIIQACNSKQLKMSNAIRNRHCWML